MTVQFGQGPLPILQDCKDDVLTNPSWQLGFEKLPSSRNSARCFTESKERKSVVFKVLSDNIGRSATT
jgi:hypothetical protein